MPAGEKCVITDWKRIWQLVSGIHYETPQSTVLDELLSISQELQDGLLQFKPKSATNAELETLLKSKKQEKLLLFTTRLQELVDLETTQCWEILCYYLTKEYRGSASFLTTLISTESSMTKLLDDIWSYYSLERMIVLKIVKNLLLFYNVANHPFHAEYKQVVDKISLSKLRDSYLTQLEHLINANPPKKLTAGECFNYESKLITWSERNAREINEVLHILLLICEHLPVSLSLIKQVFDCFKHHSFGKQQSFLNNKNSYHNELITAVTYSELMLLLKCLDFDNPEQCESLIGDIYEALETDVSNMYHSAEHGPLLLVWTILDARRSSSGVEEEQITRRVEKFSRRALELKCFQYFHQIVTHKMFQDDSLVSRIVRKTIFNQLCYMCNIFDKDGRCARNAYIYELLAELLSWPQLAKEFCISDGGIHSLFNTLIETFPLDFTNISLLAYALTKAGQGNYIKQQFEVLPIFTELYDENRHRLRALNGDDYVLEQPLKPFPCIDYIIPAGTSVCVMTQKMGYCVHIRTSVNYFNVLHHEINCLLKETTQLQPDFQNNERIRRVDAGLKFLDVAIQRIKCLSQISVEMVHPTEMCIDILQKFKYVQCPPIQLLANCLNVCTALLPLVDNEIFTRVYNLNILPIVTHESVHDYKKYANGVYFESRVLGCYVDDVEKSRQSYVFLHAYLAFLRTYSKLQRKRYFQVEIPGMIFLLRDVFPNIQNWHFRTQTDKNKIIYEILSFLCEMLDNVSNIDSHRKDHREQQELLRNICVYNLLNLDNGLILLRFVGLGNALLQHTMELQSNWMVQQQHSLMVLVRLSMRILMQLLRLRQHIFKPSEISPLESLIYTQPKQRDTLRIIPIVTSYMSNIFDRWLPILSCRLLKRIALEFNMSLLACLDMEPDQIRLTFLQKLPDEFESDSVKIAILELVEACIQKQPGVTEALFKVDYGHEKRSFFGKDSGAQIADSVLTFMEDFLDANEIEPISYDHPLPCKIMNLFHSLWKQNLQMLVDKLVEKPKFWHKLCTPLFATLRPNVRVYTQLLNILAIEVYTSTNKKETELKDIVLKFFEQKYFEPWLKYIFDMPKLPAGEFELNDEMPDWICRLQAFKDFILILLKKQPKFIEVPNEQIRFLAKKCLEVLVERAEYVEDMRPFIVLVELYLVILLSFKHSYTKSLEEERELMEKLLHLLGLISSCYQDLHIRGKEACLSITIKCTQLHRALLVNDSTIALRFLNSVVNIICNELQNLEKSVYLELNVKNAAAKVDHDEHVATNSLVLSLNLLKTLTTIFHVDGPVNWDLPFVSARIFQRLLSCVSVTLPVYSKQNFSLQLLDVLIVFAKGNCSTEFLHCDVDEYLWLNLLPPRELLQTKDVYGKPKMDAWTAEKWWPIYARGIEFVTILFEKHSSFFLKHVLQFVGIHEQYLTDALVLCKQSLEPTAINLIKCAVTLIAKLAVCQQQWRIDNVQCMFNIMRAVQSLLGHAISMFHQPRNLKILIAGNRSQLEIIRDTENMGFTDEVIAAFNDLNEIIVLCAIALQQFSPDLVSLLCDPVFEAYKWEPLFEIHFGAPKLSEGLTTLTFGLVLSIVSVYVKVLNLQNYAFNEAPLNHLPTPVVDTSPDRGTANAGLAAITNTQLNTSPGKRSFSKSLSTASISSVNCPSNELFANLDVELCLNALEHILTLSASQSLYSLKCRGLDNREKQLIRREISSELLVFHEFVRRKVIIDHREQRNKYVRRKHGQILLKNLETAHDRATPAVQSSGTEVQRRPTTDLRNSMRVTVVRRMHLQQRQQERQQQQQPRESIGTQFEMSRVLSPISNARSHEANLAKATASTPNLARPPLRRLCDTPISEMAMTSAAAMEQERAKRANMVYDIEEEEEEMDGLEEEPEEDNIQYFAPEELQSYSALSIVQFVEEDYLHLMSNIFNAICQNE